jgi:hypothetical protein
VTGKSRPEIAVRLGRGLSLNTAKDLETEATIADGDHLDRQSEIVGRKCESGIGDESCLTHEALTRQNVAVPTSRPRQASVGRVEVLHHHEVTTKSLGVAHLAAHHDWKEVQHRHRGLTRDVGVFLHSLRENDHQIGEPQIFVLRGNLNIIEILAHSNDVVVRRVHEKIDTNLIAKPLLISTKSLQNATLLLQDNLKSLARDRLSTESKKINSPARDHLSIDSKKRSREESSLSRQDVNLLITIATNP